MDIINNNFFLHLSNPDNFILKTITAVTPPMLNKITIPKHI